MSAPCFTADEYWAHKEHTERVNRRFKLAWKVVVALFILWSLTK